MADADIDTRKKTLADNLEEMVESGAAEMTDALYGFRLFLISNEFGQLKMATQTEYISVVEYIARTISNHQDWGDSGGIRGEEMNKTMVTKMETDLHALFEQNPDMSPAMQTVLDREK